MKKLSTHHALAAFVLFISCKGGDQVSPPPKVTLDNDKVRVIEYTGFPNSDVCGIGVHQHTPHLTILLSDAKVEVNRDGKKQLEQLYKGFSFWSGSETHSVINVGDNVIRAIIVEVK